MDCVGIGDSQRTRHCAGLVSVDDVHLVAILFDMDILRVAAHGAAIKMD